MIIPAFEAVLNVIKICNEAKTLMAGLWMKTVTGGTISSLRKLPVRKNNFKKEKRVE